MRLEELANSEFGRRTILRFCRHSPRWLGHGVARVAATIIMRRDPKLCATVAENLRQVVGPQVDRAVLQDMTRRTFAHFTRANYDFLRNAGQPAEQVLTAVHLPEESIARIKSELDRGRGVLCLFPHVSSFDLAGLALAASGLSFKVLTLANPAGLFRDLNRLREEGGIGVMPISPESLRAAIRMLRGGELVVSSMDRPLARERDLIEVFGRPSYLPLGPARIALISNAKVFVGCCSYDYRDGYVVDIKGPIEMVRTGDRHRDILTNTHRLAGLLEGFVGACPEQWMMFHSFWPQLADAGQT